MQIATKYRQTEAGVIPDDWGLSTVGREFDIQLGKMVDADKNTGVLKPYLGNRSVKWNSIDVSDLPMVAMSKTDLKKYRLNDDDLLVCEGGDVGRSAVWKSPLHECYYQKALHRLKARNGFSSTLMIAFLQKWSAEGRLANFVTQTSIAHLPKDKFVTIPLPIPPLAEQRAIAEALSDVDALINALDALITKKRHIKQGTMQQLLTGKKRLPGFTGEWKETTLGDVGECVIGLTYKPRNVTDHGLLVLRSSNIQNNQLSFEDNVYVDMDVPENIIVRDGDILICVRNGSRALIGKCVRLGPEIAGQTFGAFMSIFRTEYSRFIGHLFRSFQIQRQINENLGATINQITNKVLKSFEVTLPSIAEQNAIVDVLDDMDAEITALEQKRDKTKLIKQGMMQELLTGKTRLINN